jgi:hypothetical protein
VSNSVGRGQSGHLKMTPLPSQTMAFGSLARAPVSAQTLYFQTHATRMLLKRIIAFSEKRFYTFGVMSTFLSRTEVIQ